MQTKIIPIRMETELFFKTTCFFRKTKRCNRSDAKQCETRRSDARSNPFLIVIDRGRDRYLNDKECHFFQVIVMDSDLKKVQSKLQIARSEIANVRRHLKSFKIQQDKAICNIRKQLNEFRCNNCLRFVCLSVFLITQF